jgi:hypothetical protein
MRLTFIECDRDLFVPYATSYEAEVDLCTLPPLMFVFAE